MVSWLDQIKHDADALYLLGDIVDYWFEYEMTIPKGFSRLWGKLAELSDLGIKIEWYTGNHDMWDFGYFKKELGIGIYKSYQIKQIYGKTCFLGHGDGLGKGDLKYKFIKSILSNSLCQFLFSILPSRIGIWLMKASSNTSRHSQEIDTEKSQQKEQSLFNFFEGIANENKVDYFIYGHLHTASIKRSIDGKSEYINLGDWTSLFTYAEMSPEGNLYLKKYQEPESF